jgi:hypothetical protein
VTSCCAPARPGPPPPPHTHHPLLPRPTPPPPYPPTPRTQAPEDASVTTLYVGGLTKDMTDEDLRDAFYSYGEITSLRRVESKYCAFVTFATRCGAEGGGGGVGGRREGRGRRDGGGRHGRKEGERRHEGGVQMGGVCSLGGGAAGWGCSGGWGQWGEVGRLAARKPPSGVRTKSCKARALMTDASCEPATTCLLSTAGGDGFD